MPKTLIIYLRLIDFRFISSSNKCVYLRISDTRLLCILGEKGGIWKLCGDLKEIGKEINLNVVMFQCHDVLMSRRPNVAMLRSYNVQPTSANVTMLRRHRDSPNENFLDITKRTKKKRVGGTRYEMKEDDIGRFERSCNPCTCIFFLELILIKTK